MPSRKRHGHKLRKGRHSQQGYYYFLTTVVAGRRPIFAKRELANVMLDVIRWLDNSGRFLVDAAVVMPDHLHIAGMLGQDTLDKYMHSLKSYSANKLSQQGVATPIWQRGFHDHALRDDEDHRVRVDYLIDNPVRGGLVRHAVDYPFIILPDG